MSLVIIDDQSSQLQYTGLWNAGGTTSNYDHTASSSRAAGATMSLHFNGTSASLFGGYDAGASCSGSFTLDSNVTTFTPPVLTSPLSQQLIWSSASLPDAEHTLTYTLTSCSSSSGDVWFDYLLYAPSVNASTTDGVLFFVDDTDSRLAWAGNWIPTSGNDGDFQLTSHVGSQGASFQFEFEGTLVSVHGRIGNDTNGANTEASFSIDGSSPVSFSSPPQNSITFNAALFQSDSLAPGKHTLVVTSQTGSLWIDYLLLQPDPSAQDSFASTSHSPISTGEIAALAAGAVVLAVVIALAVIFRRRLFKGRQSRTPSRNNKSRLNISAPDIASFTHVSHTPWVPPTTYPPTHSSSASFRSRETHTTSNPFDTPPPSPHARSYVTNGSSSLGGPPVTATDTFALGHAVPPPSSARMSTITATSASGSGASVPVSVSASASGHSRRHPSLGGDGDSVAELKRRQQAFLAAQPPSAPAYDELDVDAASVGGMSRSSSLRPLPRIPPAGPSHPAAPQPPAAGSGYHPYDDDELPPVYTVR
ncbi:hypothetical protein C8F01DRAFT_1149705 [Mycena amicta]|nr:hypothetical protein C8F01DRAFT_1149705 [Mycena amicta]